MKKTLTLFAAITLLTLGACSGNKTLTELTDEEKAAGWVTGMVTDEFASEGCDTLIKLDAQQSATGMEYLNPATGMGNVKPGDAVKLRYVRSRSPQTGDCNKGLWVVIESIEKR